MEELLHQHNVDEEHPPVMAPYGPPYVGCSNLVCMNVEGDDEDAVPLQGCKGCCHMAKYCSRACQQAAWSHHKPGCVAHQIQQVAETTRQETMAALLANDREAALEVAKKGAAVEAALHESLRADWGEAQRAEWLEAERTSIWLRLGALANKGREAVEEALARMA